MTPDHWSTAFTGRIAQRLRDSRRAAGLTMAEVAQGCAARGMPEITEHSIKNLESGRKTSVSVADVVMLADVLGVPAGHPAVPARFFGGGRGSAGPRAVHLGRGRVVHR